MSSTLRVWSEHETYFDPDEVVSVDGEALEREVSEHWVGMIEATSAGCAGRNTFGDFIDNISVVNGRLLVGVDDDEVTDEYKSKCPAVSGTMERTLVHIPSLHAAVSFLARPGEALQLARQGDILLVGELTEPSPGRCYVPIFGNA